MAELNSNALTSLELFKTYIDYNETDKDLLFEHLINAASDFLARYWRRTLPETTYALERYNGGGAKLFLNNYPITAIIQLCQGTVDVIRVRCTDTTVYNAYVEVDQDNNEVKLMRGGTTDATFDISNALYDTLAELATAINGTANWEATIANTDYNAYPCTQLFNKYNVYCKNIYNYLKIPDEPIDSFSVDNENGIIYLPSEFTQGFQNVYVGYVAGYAAGSIPSSAEQICIELVKYKYDMIPKDQGVASEKIGRVYAYTLRDIKGALPPELLAEADIFKSRIN